MKVLVSALALLWLRGALVKAGHIYGHDYPSSITLKAATIPCETFGDFQEDLLQRLQSIALEDNVTLTFQTTQVQKLYADNLALISHECQPGDTVVINNQEHSCDEYDLIVGDYWTSPE